MLDGVTKPHWLKVFVQIFTLVSKLYRRDIVPDKCSDFLKTINFLWIFLQNSLERGEKTLDVRWRVGYKAKWQQWRHLPKIRQPLDTCIHQVSNSLIRLPKSVMEYMSICGRRQQRYGEITSVFTHATIISLRLGPVLLTGSKFHTGMDKLSHPL